jgi:Uma2 family endonuclease
MWGLEYALLFGVPNNKLELIDGRSRWAFPFLRREEAEAHFAEWVATLCHWRGVESPAVRKGRKRWEAEAGGFGLELAPLPIELYAPFDGETFRTLYSIPWRRELWVGQPAGREEGWEDAQRHYDVQLNLWTLFGELCGRHGGQHAGRVDVVLSDTAAVAPDQYYFRKSKDECMIEGDYFRGVPDLIAEVLSPPTREIDRGPRKELYRRAGVRHLWLLDPEPESVEVYELSGPDYRLVSAHGPGDEFCPSLFPDEAVSVDALFNTQWKRHGGGLAPGQPTPMPEWLVPQEKRLGLEHLFLFGHPERRWEIWGNRAPSVLAFGSPREARARLGPFLEEAARWEQTPVPAAVGVGPDAEQAEVGRFRFTRSGRHVRLDVAVDARKYWDLLRVWSRREAWDWGED